MNRKSVKYSFFLLLIILFAGIGIAWREFNRKIPDTADRKAAFQIEAADLVKSFSADQNAADKKYLDKVLSVSGRIRQLEKDDQGNYTVTLASHESMSGVRCSIDSAHRQEFSGLGEGAVIMLKGVCTGFNQDELLGSDVILNRCALSQ